MSDAHELEQLEEEEQKFFLKQLSKIYLHHSVRWSDGLGECEGTVHEIYIERRSDYPRYFAKVTVEKATTAPHPFLGKTIRMSAADLTPNEPLSSTQRRWINRTLPPELVRPGPAVPETSPEPTWRDAVFLYASEKYRGDDCARDEFVEGNPDRKCLDLVTLHEVQVFWQRCSRIDFWLRQLAHYEESIKHARRIPYHSSRHLEQQVLEMIPGVRRKLTLYREGRPDSIDLSLELADLEHLVRRGNWVQGERLIEMGLRSRAAGQKGGLGVLANLLVEARAWLIKRGTPRPSYLEVIKVLTKVDFDGVINEINESEETIEYFLASGELSTAKFKTVQNHLSKLPK